ncbi:MAG: phosphate acyltransferase PlsX [Pseudomonadales bacterium]|nr:phosphate acyltransferase PlsX [Pseudomonadales bacterium]
MGGDYGPQVTIPAALACIDQIPELRVLLVGNIDAIRVELDKLGKQESTKLQIVYASQVVEMDDKPSVALRYKKDSSMRVAARLVKEGNAQAFVSAGNTGALMAISRYVFKTHPNIDRPAIITSIPTVKGHCNMLDLGANVDCSAKQLFQFAVMGSIISRELDDIERPRVGLLNIGEEEIKGNDQVKQANELLRNNLAINYIGYIEGDAIYSGDVDVVVCDGFVGNIALKTSEGLAKMFTSNLKEEVARSWYTKLLGLVSLPVLKRLRKRMNPSEYNGASLIGLKHIAVKSHGNADAISFATAIKLAIEEVRKNIPKLIGEGMTDPSIRLEMDKI